MVKFWELFIFSLGFLCASSTPDYPSEYKMIGAGRLPKGKGRDVAVYDGEDTIYVLGGNLGARVPDEEVFQYSISTQVASHFTNLPTFQNKGIEEGTAHIDRNGTIYYLGGRTGHWEIPHRAEIYKITRENPNITGPEAFLPIPAFAHASVFDEEKDTIYVFGGLDNQPLIHPMKYNVKTKEAVNITTATFTGTSISAVLGVRYAYIFTKRVGLYASTTISRFDTVTETIEDIEEKLPFVIYGSSSVIVDDVAWILAEEGRGIETISLIRFNTTSEKVLSIAKTPGYEGWSLTPGCTVYVPKTNRIYVFEGQETNTFTSKIQYIQLPFDCTRKKNGLYPHQSDCSKFMSCSNGNEHEFSCPSPLLFHKQKLVCDWPENVTC